MKEIRKTTPLAPLYPASSELDVIPAESVQIV